MGLSVKEKVDLVLLAETVKKIKRGDEAAMGSFYELTHRAIYRFSFFLSKDENSAHDLCHDTFVKAFLSMMEVKDEGAVLGWLFRIAKNNFLDKKKKNIEESISEEALEESQPKTPDYEKWLSVKRILKDFEVEDRMILLMVDLEGLSYKEAGTAMGLSEDAIRMKLHRIRQDFIKKFNSPETI